jgi:hypothetical protein
VAKDIPVSANRTERILAYMVASAIGLSLIAFFAVVIGTATGVRDFTGGVWPTVIVLPMIGLPIGFVLIIVVLVLSFMRRSREAKDAGK